MTIAQHKLLDQLCSKDFLLKLETSNGLTRLFRAGLDRFPCRVRRPSMSWRGVKIAETEGRTEEVARQRTQHLVDSSVFDDRRIFGPRRGVERLDNPIRLS